MKTLKVAMNPHADTTFKEIPVKKMFKLYGQTFFLHKPISSRDVRTDQWNVSEYKTGMLVQYGRTMKEALANAKETLKQRKDQLQSVVEMVISNGRQLNF